ncbi:hypothetical protein NEFER03_0540 [Nematocida sp. LUAm3]|nr:hypothetical protein NEFER03_0540 [Nematocida sp. LUAm3]KAI5175507.1 hypothetical protein NEFER02_1413 [Nematocida sp. LUAm2]KAI5178463.1 hypothetical protein NEFER01_1610 [Nematocida sp. LUAm1]
MKKLRNGNGLMITFIILTFILIFSIISSTENTASNNEPNNEEHMDNLKKCFNSQFIAQRLTGKEIADKTAFDQKYMTNGQTIKEEEVLYLFVFIPYDCVQFKDENNQIYSTTSSDFFEILFKEVQKKKLIWVYFIYNIYHQPRSFENTGKNIQTFLNSIDKLKSIVWETINLEPLNLLTHPNYKLLEYINRLRKLAIVWQYVLSENIGDSANGSNLILYNPLTRTKRDDKYTKDPNTFLSHVVNMFMKESINYKKAFILAGFLDNENKEDDPAIDAKEEELRKVEGLYTYALYSILKYKLKFFLKDNAKSDVCPWVKMDIIDNIYYRHNKERHLAATQPQTSASVSKKTIEDIDTGLTPIYFISSGFKARGIGNINFDILLALSGPQTTKIYVNIINQKIGYNRYYIKNYSPIYVDFSFCVLNSLYGECFKEFFTRTKYLLIRDIDCRSLCVLLRRRLNEIFPYVHEAPKNTQDLAESSTDPVKIETTDDDLREICPKMCMPNMVYHITEHMIFMKSTYQMEVDSEHEKYMLFDVLISKKELKNILTIEEKVRSESEKKTRHEEIQNALDKNRICSKKVLPKRDAIIKNLSWSKHYYSTKQATILEYSYVPKAELESIIEQEKNESSLNNEEEENEEEDEEIEEITPSAAKRHHKKSKVESSFNKRKRLSNNNIDVPFENINVDQWVPMTDPEFFYDNIPYIPSAPSTSSYTAPSSSSALPAISDIYSFTDKYDSIFIDSYTDYTDKPENNPSASRVPEEITYPQHEDMRYMNEQYAQDPYAYQPQWNAQHGNMQYMDEQYAHDPYAYQPQWNIQHEDEQPIPDDLIDVVLQPMTPTPQPNETRHAPIGHANADRAGA